MENNDDLRGEYSNDFNSDNIINLIRDVIREPTERPTFRNIFAHLAMNIIERGMVREAEARSLEENNKPIVATMEQMESLGNYQRVTKEEVCEDNTCCICLAPYKMGEGKRTLGCEHSFHKKCIDKWLTTSKTECPICRKNPFD
tara:strand:- start:4437 stop:4868 length:432 start_codon:yes stop_codon:yes gene_type:complete